MRRDQVLAAASACVTKDRAHTHGPVEDNFHTIAMFWRDYLQARFGVCPTIEKHDVASMMALVKIARTAKNPKHGDNWIDMAGYAACGGEVAGAE